ncbi:hypothetical protein D0T84_08875 [Dysgonomonas sp. 521]|uniref:hypothetical protein n=1 Tax=Dysgonomonas sp. 521 TaxID=2302932 RepID=UPI0013D1B950|nr:hypothetical protein [Dysgonomonas sp. 521]NDV95029.1 hypothetical protein [Dysgonomonas sp. 521]
MTDLTKYWLNIFLLFIFILSSCSTENTKKKLTYEGISFTCPVNWIVKTSTLPGESYSIRAQSGNNVLFITFTDKKGINPKDLIEGYFSEIDSTKYQLKTENITSSNFGKYEGLSSRFTIANHSVHACGNMYAFKEGEKSIFIVKQSDTEEHLEQNFKIIEDSFNIEAAQ